MTHHIKPMEVRKLWSTNLANSGEAYPDMPSSASIRSIFAQIRTSSITCPRRRFEHNEPPIVASSTMTSSRSPVKIESQRAPAVKKASLKSSGTSWNWNVVWNPGWDCPMPADGCSDGCTKISFWVGCSIGSKVGPHTVGFTVGCRVASNVGL